jgi:glycosyltransferase involved in cell wall biosynthesis
MRPSMTAGPRALYLCYFGLREPLVQTQVLPYVRQLAGGGTAMSLLTFEPEIHRRWTAVEMERWRARLRDEGIDWHALPYHKRPSLAATLFDILRGAIRAGRLVRRQGIGILHARSHVAAAMAALAKWWTGVPFIFDVRGLLAEEYVASGNWREGGLLFRLTKAAERLLFRSADGFVVLTERVRVRLAAQTGERPVAMIPCCVDESRLERSDRDATRVALGVSDRNVWACLGTLGGFYMVDEVAELFAVARELDPRAYLLVLTRSSPERLAARLERLGVPVDAYRVLESGPEDVSRYLSAADVGVLLLGASGAHVASSPTKFAEYLAAGLPVVSTRGIGDLDEEIPASGVGTLLPALDRDGYLAACREIEKLRQDPGLAARCRDHARTRYGLRSIGGERYRRLYRELAERR